MATKNIVNPAFNFSSLINDIKTQVQSTSSNLHIPDIMEFCNSPEYLNLPGQNVHLYPMQKIILICFYRGQLGNEHLTLSDEDIEILHANKLTNVIEKYQSGQLFRELVLVLGRRSGKNITSSIIASYEAMRLLELPGGCPLAFYHLAPGNPIFIITIANSSGQARLLFTDIKARVQLSPYFQGKIGFVGESEIYLLTNEDRKTQEKLITAGITDHSSIIKGSVSIMSGHSNSKTLLGKRSIAILFDEVATYPSAGVISSGESLYSDLAPATADFKRQIGTEPDGTPIMITDSKIISISSPRAEEGILYKMYVDAPKTPNRLAFKLPTWKVNLSLSEKSLRAENNVLSPSRFAMEFGAEFSGTSGEKFVADAYVDKAIELGNNIDLDQRTIGIPGVVYYAHLDPASTSHNYALVVVHTEQRMRLVQKDGKQHKEKFTLFVVDHVMAWQPQTNEAIKVSMVDQYILGLAKKFRFGMVSYDDWNSLSSIQLLRSKGVPTKQTPFRQKYKTFIYDHLENLLVNNRLALPRKGPWANILEMELKCLKKIFSGTSFRIKPNPEAQVITDDCVDALAGACAMAVDNAFNGYPYIATTYLPQGRGINSSNNWNIGGASYTDSQWKYMHQKFGI